MKKGFTLIELLLMVTIISLLSNIVLASLSGLRDDARTARAEQETAQIVNFIQAAQIETGGRTLSEITGS